MKGPTDLSIHQIAKEVHGTKFILLPCTPKGPIPFRCLSSLPTLPEETPIQGLTTKSPS